MVRSYQIVDADAHVNPPPTFWSEYLPQSLRDRAPKLVYDKIEDCDYVEFEGTRKKVNLIGAQAGRAGAEFKLHGKLTDARSGGWMPAERLDDMDKDGMDVSVLFGGGPIGTLDEELYMASFDAYNRWLTDFCSYAPDRFCGVGYIPMREVADSIEMLKSLARAGFTAVNIPAFPQPLAKLEFKTGGAAQSSALTGDPLGPRRYDQPEFDPFWAAAQDLDMALTFHLGARTTRYWEPDKFLADLVMSKVTMAEPIAIMIFGGVFQRFPKLRVGAIESGVGWLAWMANYMDETWFKQRFWTKNTLSEPPSYYMDQNIFASFIHDSVGIRTRHFPGAKNIMWSSDYPHSETTFPNSLETIDRLFKDIPLQDRIEVVGGIAKRFYRAGEGRVRDRSREQKVSAA